MSEPRGRVAVITGSTSGIGLGIAEALAAEGCNLVVNGISTVEDGRALVARLEREFNVRVLFHPADLSDPEQCNTLIHDAEKHFGRIDILINNTGIQFVAPVKDACKFCLVVRLRGDRW